MIVGSAQERPFAECIDEALAAWEAYRQIGFVPAVIFTFLGEAVNGKIAVCAGLSFDQENPHHVVVCGVPTEPIEAAEFGDRWAERAKWWNETATEAERRAIYDRSWVRANLVELAISCERAQLYKSA